MTERLGLAKCNYVTKATSIYELKFVQVQNARQVQGQVSACVTVQQLGTVTAVPNDTFQQSGHIT